MRKFISTLLIITLTLFCSMSSQGQFPTLPKLPDNPVIPASVRPSQAVFYDGFDNGYNSPWSFYQGTHLFTDGILRLTTANSSIYSGEYAYVKGNWTNITVQADVRLDTNTFGASVGLRYDYAKGAGYSAWIYASPPRFVLKKYNNWYNSTMEFASTNIAGLGTNTHTIKLSVTNNTLTAKLDDAHILTFTDTTALKPAGISLSVIGGSVEYDNVTVYDLNQPYVPKPQISGMTKRIITTQGKTMTLKITASGNPVYKWYFGGSSVPIPGATNDTLTITNAKTSNAGFYKVTAENLGGATYGTANTTVFTTNILPQCSTGMVSAKVEWDYNFTNETTVTGFRIYSGVSPGVYTNIATINGKVTEGRITNLLAGVTNYISVTATNPARLESVYADEAIYVPWGIITNINLNIYYMSAFGYPALQAKICPNQSITLYYSNNLASWTMLTNVIADEYGNAVYDDVSARGIPARFYKVSVP